EMPEWGTAEVEDPGEEKESPFAAAYEGMTYQDTTDDDTEGAVADGGGPPPDLDFEREADRVGKRLRFISTVARLWQVAAWRSSQLSRPSEVETTLQGWLTTNPPFSILDPRMPVLPLALSPPPPPGSL